MELIMNVGAPQYVFASAHPRASPCTETYPGCGLLGEVGQLKARVAKLGIHGRPPWQAHMGVEGARQVGMHCVLICELCGSSAVLGGNTRAQVTPAQDILVSTSLGLAWCIIKHV